MSVDDAFFARRERRTGRSAGSHNPDTSDSPTAASANTADVRTSRRSLGRRSEPDEDTRRSNRKRKKDGIRSLKIDESLSSLTSFRKSMKKRIRRTVAGAEQTKEKKKKKKKKKKEEKKRRSSGSRNSRSSSRSPTVLTSPIAERKLPSILHGDMELPSPGLVDRISRGASFAASSSTTLGALKSRKKKKTKEKKEKEKEKKKKKKKIRNKFSPSSSAAALRRTRAKLTPKAGSSSKGCASISVAKPPSHALPASYREDAEEVVKLSFSDDEMTFLRGGARAGLKQTRTVRDHTPTPKKAGRRQRSSPTQSPVRKAVTFADLSADQQRVYRMVVNDRKNVLMLGEGGTGKTELIKLIAKEFKALRIKVEVTASTGKAALLIGGSTVHSFAGIKKGTGTVAELLALVRGNRYVRARWRNTKVLILDEVSMISAELLYKLDRIARAIRPSGMKKPFGGMQILASGDFLQLPPVKADYCFKHACFDAIFPVAQRVVLMHNFRQDKDPGFRKVLQSMRWSNISAEADALMQGRVGVVPDDDTPATIIFPLRRQVDELNKEKMAELEGKVHSFKYEFFNMPSCSAKQAQFLHDLLLSSTPVARGEKFHGKMRGVLELKVGARVMHTCNNKETGKVNGSLGTVEAFEAVTGNPVIKWADGTRHSVGRHTWASNCNKATLVQYPLIVAWAMTVHKAQGATLDAAIVDLGPTVFEYNQAYTAASRVRRLQDLYLLNWQGRVAKPHYEALKFYADLGVTPALKALAQGTVQAEFESRQKRKAACASSSSSSTSAFSKQFDAPPSPSQHEVDEALADFGISAVSSVANSAGGAKKKQKATRQAFATEQASAAHDFVEHEFLMFTEHNGPESEKWFRYFLGKGVDVAAVSARLNKLNKTVAQGGGLDGATCFAIEPVSAVTYAMSKMDDEMGSVKVHKVFRKALDQSKLTSGSDKELFDRLHKCGVEACVR